MLVVFSPRYRHGRRGVALVVRRRFDFFLCRFAVLLRGFRRIAVALQCRFVSLRSRRCVGDIIHSGQQHDRLRVVRHLVHRCWSLRCHCLRVAHR